MLVIISTWHSVDDLQRAFSSFAKQMKEEQVRIWQ